MYINKRIRQLRPVPTMIFVCASGVYLPKNTIPINMLPILLCS